MPIDLTCPACRRQLRVADKYAGRRGTCPACDAVITIPDDTPDFELVPEDRRTYDNIILEPATRPAAKLQPTAEQPPPAENLQRLADESPGQRRLREALDHRPEPPRVPWWRRELIVLFGVGITPAWLLLIPLAVAGFGVWFATGPGRGVQVSSVTPVLAVEVLDAARRHDPATLVNPGAGGVFRQAAAGVGATGPATHTMDLTVGGSDRLLVTQPDPGGDLVALDVAVSQRLINNLGQTRKYDNHLKADAFTLRRRSDPPGGGSPAMLAARTFDQPIDLDLAGAPTSNPRKLLPPVAADRLEEQKLPGVIAGEAEYALGTARGTVTYTAMRSTSGMPAGPGLSADGTLRLDHPDPDGPAVTADYQGGRLAVSWNPEARGRWVQPSLTEPTRTSPWSRSHFTLLFFRPPDAGTYVLSFAGRDVATVKLDRARQPSPPTPSPIASNRPGGPQPQSKNSNSPLAYFDILRDARGQAQGLVSANHMRQIGFALQLYLNDHNNQFPESLLELRPYLPNLDQLMVNPRTNARPGFIYEQPPPGSPPATTPILYESFNGQPDPDGAILYGDGSIR
ncbi:MAG: hypothetical protein AAF750_18335 [Planctomycetota bacterium]